MNNLLENIAFFLNFLRVDFFIPFGECSIIYLLVYPFLKEKNWLIRFDEQSVKLTSFIGFVYLILFLFITVIGIITVNEAERHIHLGRMFGPYWFGYWLQPILYFIMAMLLQRKKIAKNIILRIIFTIISLVTIERYVIIITSLHRDFLPSSWVMIYPDDNYKIGFWFILKICIYVLMVGFFYFITKQLKYFKLSRAKN